jgi:O-antigen/teichoic acid export membrane protein
MSQAENNEEVKRIFLSSINLSLFVFLPLCSTVIIFSDVFFKYILGDEWIIASDYLVPLVIGFSIFPLHVLNLNLLQVKKRSDLYLKVEVYKKIVGLSVFYVSYRYGVMGICIGIAVTSYLCYFINAYYSMRLFGISIFDQLKVIVPVFVVNCVGVLVALEVSFSDLGLIFTSFVQWVVYFSLSVLMYYLLFRDSFLGNVKLFFW